MAIEHETYMREALLQARKALAEGEFPVGCVLETGGAVIARGRRRNSAAGTVKELDHAEIVALRNLQASTEAVDPSRVTVYCTMEPCLMCTATLLLNGFSTIVYGYEDVMGGSSRLPAHGLAPLYLGMKLSVTPSVLRGESLALVQQFFRRPDNAYWKDSLLARYTLEQTAE
jgi:tRNA(adenine34) deaminase